eukprot:TRINITY_DN6894_c0_g1_i2.p2 TRINITY_DN6894_c0_g1~~TRINITY_DN6894_c0_g1_i2.p2  ORF type:complete len:321 (+),score=64.05 TRINITY_DN6894_c0_g1_i2:90-965(+)
MPRPPPQQRSRRLKEPAIPGAPKEYRLKIKGVMRLAQHRTIAQAHAGYAQLIRKELLMNPSDAVLQAAQALLDANMHGGVPFAIEDGHCSEDSSETGRATAAACMQDQWPAAPPAGPGADRRRRAIAAARAAEAVRLERAAAPAGEGRGGGEPLEPLATPELPTPRPPPRVLSGRGSASPAAGTRGTGGGPVAPFAAPFAPRRPSAAVSPPAAEQGAAAQAATRLEADALARRAAAAAKLGNGKRAGRVPREPVPRIHTGELNAMLTRRTLERIAAPQIAAPMTLPGVGAN